MINRFYVTPIGRIRSHNCSSGITNLAAPPRQEGHRKEVQLSFPKSDVLLLEREVVSRARWKSDEVPCAISTRRMLLNSHLLILHDSGQVHFEKKDIFVSDFFIKLLRQRPLTVLGKLSQVFGVDKCDKRALIEELESTGPKFFHGLAIRKGPGCRRDGMISRSLPLIENINE